MRISIASFNRMRKHLAKAAGIKTPSAPKTVNANENRFNRLILGCAGNFEPRHFTITESGKVYTPDFSFDANGKTIFIEVKGKYRSAKDEKLICDRSRLAWEIAGDKNKEYGWVWAKYERFGYECEMRLPDGSRIKRDCKNNKNFIELLKEGGYGEK